MTGYLVLVTVSMPLSGKLADLVAVCRVLLASTGVFAAACAAGALSISMEVLAGVRAVQGAGAGGILVAVQVLNGEMAPPRDRARYFVYVTTIFGSGTLPGRSWAA